MATLEETPPELAGDLSREGILLAGGGTLLRGLDERMHQRDRDAGHVAESPLTCVAVGSGRALDHFDVLQRSSRPGGTCLSWEGGGPGVRCAPRGRAEWLPMFGPVWVVVNQRLGVVGDASAVVVDWLRSLWG